MEKTKVLLADSDARRLAQLTTQLLDKGMEVVSTNDAVHAMSMARQARPDIILLSSQLAGGGLAALKRLRSNVYTACIPVLGIVPATRSQEREMLQAGAQQCLALPVDGAALQAALDKHVPQSLDFTQAPAEVLAAPRRMEAVTESGLLDSPPEPGFDRLTQLATQLLGTPTALVTLVDADRQFFKSEVGLPQPWAGARQTRLSHSFCQWVVASREPVVVGDAREHAALRSNLAIRDLGVTAYAGVPLSGKGGEAIGSMCAIDSKPRAWSDEDLATLEDLGKIAQAYAASDRAGRAGGNGDLARYVAGHAVAAVTSILRRYGSRIADAQREALLGILGEQSERLLPAR